MAALFTFGLKQPDGSWRNYTGSINDQTDTYGNNVSIYESQTKEEREAKAKKNYFANGKVIWNDGKITTAEKKDVRSKPGINSSPVDDLPF